LFKDFENFHVGPHFCLMINYITADGKNVASLSIYK